MKVVINNDTEVVTYDGIGNLDEFYADGWLLFEKNGTKGRVPFRVDSSVEYARNEIEAEIRLIKDVTDVIWIKK